MKFAHIADCHLGGWRQKELQVLNFKSFQSAIRICLDEKVDFILIAGDLFDSAYPPIEILRDAFSEFKKIYDHGIPVFIIAGSHDFSASGRTFLDVLEKAGFCKNAENFENDGEKIILKPLNFKDIEIFGYPGKKSGMEIEDLKRVHFNSLSRFCIFMIHTTIKDVVGEIPMESIEKERLPAANYYAMGHVHKVYEVGDELRKYVYPGPTFPNNFQELLDLKAGSFNIVEVDGMRIKTRNIKLENKEVVGLNIYIEDALTATDKIIREIDRHNLYDKILLLKLYGTLKKGKSADINFKEIEEFVKKKGAYVFLRNISSLKSLGGEIGEFVGGSNDFSLIEFEAIREFSKANDEKFNKHIQRLLEAMSLEKKEDEKSVVFEERLISEIKNSLDMGSYEI